MSPAPAAVTALRPDVLLVLLEASEPHVTTAREVTSVEQAIAAGWAALQMFQPELAKREWLSAVNRCPALRSKIEPLVRLALTFSGTLDDA